MEYIAALEREIDHLKDLIAEAYVTQRACRHVDEKWMGKARVAIEGRATVILDPLLLLAVILGDAPVKNAPVGEYEKR